MSTDRRSDDLGKRLLPGDRHGGGGVDVDEADDPVVLRRGFTAFNPGEPEDSKNLVYVCMLCLLYTSPSPRDRG